MTRSSKNKKLQKENLLGRITVEKQRVEISLSRDTSVGLFDTKAQRCLGNSKEAKQVNDFLAIVISNLNEIRKHLILEGKVITAELIRARYKGDPDPDVVRFPTVLELYESHNKKFKELIGIDVTESTYQRHLTSKAHVERFIKYKFCKNDVDLLKIDYKFLCDFEHYFKTVRKCNHNSTMKYIKNLGKVIRLALAEGYMTKNPFDKFKLTYEQVHRDILNQDEVDRMVKIKIPEARLDRIRDMFVFCIYTGVAFADVIALRMHHITIDKNGTQWIKNKRMKTKVEFLVPILEVPKKIVEKYKDHPQRQEDGRVIPEISNQNYNVYLKELAVRCKIGINLSSHIARHTFATTITLENGVPLEVVSKMLGHTDTKTTQIYAKIHEKAIMNGMKNLMDKEEESKN